METAILNPIGKGQFTIPFQWRKKLGIMGEKIEAFFDGAQVILKPLNPSLAWDIDQVSLNTLSPKDKKIIEGGREAYKKGETEKFLSFDDVFGKA